MNEEVNHDVYGVEHAEVDEFGGEMTAKTVKDEQTTLIGIGWSCERWE